MSAAPVIAAGATLGLTILTKLAANQAQAQFNAIEPVGFDILNPLGSLTAGTAQFTAYLRLQVFIGMVWLVAILGTVITAFFVYQDLYPQGIQTIATRTISKTPQARSAKSVKAAVKVLRGSVQ